LAKAKAGRAVVCCVFGTRPEAIKFAPLVMALREQPSFLCRVVITSQHREMLDPVLALFHIVPDAHLGLMKAGQSLFHIASHVLRRMESVFQEISPDLVLVQGDTVTAFCAALSAFFLKIPVAHVEAGLRTRDKFHPFPEEMNRCLITHIADWHFAPTASAEENLRREGVAPEGIFITGNTVIDTARYVARRSTSFAMPVLDRVPFAGKKVLLVTAHRRESFGEPYREICRAIRDTLHEHRDVHVLFPYHLNPNASGPAREILGGEEAVTLVPPLIYPDLILSLRKAYAVFTDSGGIQEEAPSFGKPVFVLREKTERPEAVQAGTVKLAGNRYETVRACLQEILMDSAVYDRMSRAVNPYGDGKASERILEVLRTGRLENRFRPNG